MNLSDSHKGCPYIVGGLLRGLIMNKQKVLFVCIENAGRSQMAEAFAKLYPDIIDAYSAGSKPSGKLNPQVVAVLQDIDIDISKNTSKGFNSLPIKNFDYVVTMGCGDTCPFVPAKEHIDWKIEDPKGKELDEVAKIRDIIKDKVEDLVNFIKERKLS
jgi:arsenate reductase